MLFVFIDEKFYRAQQLTSKQENNFSIPIEIVLNHHEKQKPVNRKIFVFIEEKFFNQDNVQKIFSVLASKYPEPKELTIELMSDREMLKRSINTETSGVIVCFFCATPECEKAETEYYEKYFPLPKGYFRASYYRGYDGYEYYSYSPVKEEYVVIRRTLKSPPPKPNEEKSSMTLLAAVNNGDLATLNRLLSKGSNPNVKDDNGLTPLMIASFDVDEEYAKTLIKSGSKINAQQDFKGFTALMYASFTGRLNIVKTLVSSGADVNLTTIAGLTALMGGATYNRMEIIMLLLQAGAKINAKNVDGQTALMMAGDSTKVIEILLQAGADKEAKDALGWTALFHAISNDQPNKVEALLKNGADVNTKNKDGLTPLAFAEQRRNSPNSSKIIALLKQAGAK